MFRISKELLKVLGEEPSQWKRAETADEGQKRYASTEEGRHYMLEMVLSPEKPPDTDEIKAVLGKLMPWDSYELTFKNPAMGPLEDSVCVIRGEGGGAPQFEDRLQDIMRGKVEVGLVITKTIRDNGVCSVYEWEAFAEFLTGRGDVEDAPGALPAYLNGLLAEHPGGVNFLVHDTEVDAATGAVAFANTDANPILCESREKTLAMYNDASLYMGRTKNVLLPGDFHVSEERCKFPEGSGQAVRELFGRYETIYSLLYLAAASWFEQGSLVVQLMKGGMEFALPVSEITYNPHAFHLVSWAFRKGNALERAEIVRDVLALYCRNKEEIYGMSGGILKAARSSYKLYRQKDLSQYLALRQKLGDSVLESARQVQSLIESLIGGFEKNFIAVVTVIITQLLAQNIQFENMLNGELMSPDFFAVLCIFTIASGLYLVATLFSTFTKWDFYRERYKLLREQYEELLDPAEVKEAFKNDRLFKEATSKLTRYALAVAAMWVVLLVTVWVLGSAL